MTAQLAISLKFIIVALQSGHSVFGNLIPAEHACEYYKGAKENAKTDLNRLVPVEAKLLEVLPDRSQNRVHCKLQVSAEA